MWTKILASVRKPVPISSGHKTTLLHAPFHSEVRASVPAIALMAVFDWESADAILAIVVALVVARSGYGILRETIPVLVDERAMDPAAIESLAASIEGVRGTSQIRSRGRPGEGFAELTIHVAHRETVVSAHEIADEVERIIAAEMEFADVTVHVEPAAESSG